MVSERGSVGDQKRLFWRVKEPLSETSVAKTQVIVGYFQETELQLVDNQHFINGVWDVGFLFENPRRQETRNYINVSSTNSEKFRTYSYCLIIDFTPQSYLLFFIYR